MKTRRPTTLRLSLEPDRMSGAERLSVWQAAMRTAGEVLVEEPDRLSAELISRSLGDLRTMRVTATTFRLRRNRAMAREVRRDHLFLNLLESGRLEGRLAGRDVEMSPGAVAISRLARPIDILLEDATWLGLIIPRASLQKRMRRMARFDTQVFDAGSSQAVMLGGLLRSLCSLPDPLSIRDGDLAEHASLAFVTACLEGPARASSPVIEAPGDPARPIRRFIAEQLTDPELDIDRICREFGMSRSGLYRVMGDSADIATIIRRMRLKGVHRDIVSGAFDGRSLAIIARRWGLLDARSFRRAFAREFGASPSAVRQRAMATRSTGEEARKAISDDIERWFLGL